MKEEENVHLFVATAWRCDCGVECRSIPAHIESHRIKDLTKATAKNT